MCARRARFKLLMCSRLLVQSCPKLYSKVLLCPPSTSRSMGVNTYNNLMPRASNRPCLFFLAPQRQGATRQHFSWEPRLEKCQGRLASGWGSAWCLPRLTGNRTCPVAVQYLLKPAFRISFRSFGSSRHWGGKNFPPSHFYSWASCMCIHGSMGCTPFPTVQCCFNL